MNAFYELGTSQRRRHHLLAVATGTAHTDPAHDIRTGLARAQYTPTQRTRRTLLIPTSTRWTIS